MVNVRRRCKHPAAVGLTFWCLLTAAITTSSSAAIVGSAGDVVQIAPPPSVVPQALENDSQVYVFDEAQHVGLPTNVRVNISSPGTYDDWCELTPDVIPAGSEVSSYLLHADNPEFCRWVVLEGSITFDSDILGVIVSKHALNESDAALGAIGTDYPSGLQSIFRGPELFCGLDSVVVEPDLRTLTMRLTAGVTIDQIRVITDAPEPTVLSLLVLGILPAIRTRRR